MAVLLFPNTIIQIQGPSSGPTYIFYRMFPGKDANDSFTLVETYRSGDIPEEADTAPHEAEHDAQQLVVAMEDYAVASSAQTNLEYAPEGFRIVYGSNEVSLQHFQCRIAELIGRPITT
jgi:carnitine monooxygenase subunit